MSLDTCVLLAHCRSYQSDLLEDLIDRAAAELALGQHFHGKTVLLKPNLISATGPRYSCTNGRFIAVIAKWFLDHGAKVRLGDSPAFGSCARVCGSHGIVDALQGLDVEIVEFTAPRLTRLQNGMMLPVAQEALECDLFAGLPKVKAHNQMLVTLAVKNLFGTVKGVRKGLLHMQHGGCHEDFAAIILELAELFPAQIHFADGIEVMHRSGPLDGESLHLGCFGAARNPLALDTAMLRVLGLAPDSSPLWRVASGLGKTGSASCSLCFPWLAPVAFAGAGFVAPLFLNGIRFNPLRFLKGMVKRLYLRLLMD